MDEEYELIELFKDTICQFIYEHNAKLKLHNGPDGIKILIKDFDSGRISAMDLEDLEELNQMS